MMQFSTVNHLAGLLELNPSPSDQLKWKLHFSAQSVPFTAGHPDCRKVFLPPGSPLVRSDVWGFHGMGIPAADVPVVTLAIWQGPSSEWSVLTLVKRWCSSDGCGCATWSTSLALMLTAHSRSWSCSVLAAGLTGTEFWMISWWRDGAFSDGCGCATWWCPSLILTASTW